MTLAEFLADVQARVARIGEAIADGDFAFAARIAGDLEADIGRWRNAVRKRRLALAVGERPAEVYRPIDSCMRCDERRPLHELGHELLCSECAIAAEDAAA